MKPWSDRNWTSRDGLKLHYRDYAGRADRPPICVTPPAITPGIPKRMSRRMPGVMRGQRNFSSIIVRLKSGVTIAQAQKEAADKAAASATKFPGNDPTKAPKDFEWRGRANSAPGSKQGNYHNPKTGESLRPDLSHPKPIGPHWDYRDPSGKWWRIKPDGSMEPK